ncbi:hypothetical protein [Methanosarcina barkeri]|uniref:hypothetical protein n=1 Tax=Methanosarcina barkeri TaxID=2208 RepID=UPI00064F96FF|nr:hypothetical protein [Methanosarcina barkeri]
MNYIIKDPLSFIVENLANNENHKNIFRFKVTSIKENLELEETEHQEYLKDRIVMSLYKRRLSNYQDITPKMKVTEIKKTVTFIDLVVNRQIYIFLNTLFYIVIYMVIHYLM